MLIILGHKPKIKKLTIFQFKDRVAHRLPEAIMSTDFYLIRWIRITNFNIEEAENLLMEVIKLV